MSSNSLSNAGSGSDTTTELARERNREASDRTFMSWIRTSLALIGFGFGLGKVHSYMEAAFPDIDLNPVANIRLYGGAFMALGAFCLIGAGIQHWQALRKIKRLDFTYDPPWPLTGAVAAIIFLIFLVAFIELLLF